QRRSPFRLPRERGWEAAGNAACGSDSGRNGRGRRCTDGPRVSLSDIAKYIRTWGTTGAVAPSGRALARRMVRHVDPRGTGIILELGPGTGVVTRALIEKGIAPERILAVEFNPEFCRIVGERYPGVRVIEGD